MDFYAKIICDSISTSGVRLVTSELCYPRFIHSEFMTHRVFSRNSASSRAIPVRKKLERIDENPVEPVEWGVNKPGMQSSELCTPEVEREAKGLWHSARLSAMASARQLDQLKVHKQVANRIIEPWDWMVTLVTSTKHQNFDVLRDHQAADPNIRKLAQIWKSARAQSIPKVIADGHWHLPFISDADYLELGLEDSKKVSAGRCARLSYLTHDGRRDYCEDIKLAERLTKDGHWTPLEHQATPLVGIKFIKLPYEGDGTWLDAGDHCAFCESCFGDQAVEVKDAYGECKEICSKCAQGWITSGNLVGWTSFRKEFPNEGGGE